MTPLEMGMRESSAWPAPVWPDALRAAFESHCEAFWRDDKNHDGYDFVDNSRCARADNAEEVAAYEEAVADGCCGFYDVEIELCGIKVLWGFNYGH